MALYFAQIAPAEDKPGAYGVFFPDLEGCVTYGENLADALAQAQDCLTGYLNTCLKLGEEINPPSTLKEAPKKAEAYCREIGLEIPDGAFNQAIQSRPLDEKPVSLCISMLPSLICEIDAAAKQAGISRSDFLTLAARKFAAEVAAGL